MKSKISGYKKILLKINSANGLRNAIKALSVIGALFCLSYLALYLLQDGYVNLHERVYFDNVFYDMWMRLKNFDVTISESVIGAEAFLVNGKTVAYFLPLPALIRGILSLFNYGSYSVVSMLIAFLLFVICSGFIFSLVIENIVPKDKNNREIKIGWLAFITFGSPFLSILVNSSTYWEAIAWGAATVMICLYLSVAILLKPKSISRLIFFGVACGLTLFTKPTSGIGVCVLFSLTVLMLFIKALQSDNIKINPSNKSYHKYEIVGVGAIFCIFGIFLCALNYARWGNPLEFAPLDKHIQLIGNERGKNFEKYGSFQLDRIPENISYYLLPSSDNFSFESPFIQAGHSNYFMGFAKNFDYREPTLPIPVVLPVFSLFAVLGCAFYVKNLISSFNNKCEEASSYPFLFPAALSAWIPAIVLLPFNAQALRYSGEFIPGIVFFSIFAIAIFLKRSNSTKLQNNERILILYLLVIGSLLLLSIYTVTSSLITERQIFHIYSTSSSRPSTSKIISSFSLLFSKFSIPSHDSSLLNYVKNLPNASPVALKFLDREIRGNLYLVIPLISSIKQHLFVTRHFG